MIRTQGFIRLAAILLVMVLALTACASAGREQAGAAPEAEAETGKTVDGAETTGTQEAAAQPEEELPEAAQEEESTAQPEEETAGLRKFPAFTGKNLEGEPVDSGTLFGENTVTAVNFWFTTCGPCVGELSALDTLNRELAQRGGALVGINVFTLDENTAQIAEAQKVLEQQGAAYENIYFDTDSEAGRFAMGIYAYPTTYVVDARGCIVGEPVVGAVTGRAQMEMLQRLVEQALEGQEGETENG